MIYSFIKLLIRNSLPDYPVNYIIYFSVLLICAINHIFVVNNRESLIYNKITIIKKAVLSCKTGSNTKFHHIMKALFHTYMKIFKLPI